MPDRPRGVLPKPPICRFGPVVPITGIDMTMMSGFSAARLS